MIHQIEPFYFFDNFFFRMREYANMRKCTHTQPHISKPCHAISLYFIALLCNYQVYFKHKEHTLPRENKSTQRNLAKKTYMEFRIKIK